MKAIRTAVVPALALLGAAVPGQAITPASPVGARPVAAIGSIAARANVFSPSAVSAAGGQLRAKAAFFSPRPVTSSGTLSAQGDFEVPPIVPASSAQPILQPPK